MKESFSVFKRTDIPQTKHVLFLDSLKLRANGRNDSQQSCLRLHGAKKFDRFQTLRNNSQQHATTCNRVCKRTQHVSSNNVGNCWPSMLRPFALGRNPKSDQHQFSLNTIHKSSRGNVMTINEMIT